MLTPQDVRSVQFEKNLRGYRTEDVDVFWTRSRNSSTAMMHRWSSFGNRSPI